MVEEKIKKLGLRKIDDYIYHKHLKFFHLRGEDVSKWTYYKTYGEEVMFYTENYLNKTSIEILKQKDQEWEKKFKKIIIKRFDLVLFKLGLKIFRWKKNYSDSPPS